MPAKLLAHNGPLINRKHFNHSQWLQGCTEATSVHAIPYLVWAIARRLKRSPDCFQINLVFVKPDDYSVLHIFLRHLWSQTNYLAFLSLNRICQQLAQARLAAKGPARHATWCPGRQSPRARPRARVWPRSLSGPAAGRQRSTHRHQGPRQFNSHRTIRTSRKDSWEAKTVKAVSRK